MSLSPAAQIFPFLNILLLKSQFIYVSNFKKGFIRFFWKMARKWFSRQITRKCDQGWPATAMLILSRDHKFRGSGRGFAPITGAELSTEKVNLKLITENLRLLFLLHFRELFSQIILWLGTVRIIISISSEFASTTT
jgi:hypothetical protein